MNPWTRRVGSEIGKHVLESWQSILAFKLPGRIKISFPLHCNREQQARNPARFYLLGLDAQNSTHFLWSKRLSFLADQIITDFFSIMPSFG